MLATKKGIHKKVILVFLIMLFVSIFPIITLSFTTGEVIEAYNQYNLEKIKKVDSQ